MFNGIGLALSEHRPAGVPQVAYDFLNGNIGNLTFNGTTNRWYFNSSGVLTQASSGMPRVDYDPATLQKRGLRIDMQTRTNLFLNSQAPANQGIVVTAQPYTLSFYGTGTISWSGAAVGSLVGTGTNNLVQSTFTPAAGTVSFTITGSVSNVQFEAGGFATSRIVTAGASATRTAEELFTTSISPWFNTTEGTLLLEFTSDYAAPVSTFPFVGGFSNNATAEQIAITQNSARLVRSLVQTGAVQQAQMDLMTETLGGVVKAAMSWKVNNVNGCANGGTIFSDTSANMATIDRLIFGSPIVGNGTFAKCCWLRGFKYWNYQVENQTLKQITL